MPLIVQQDQLLAIKRNHECLRLKNSDDVFQNFISQFPEFGMTSEQKLRQYFTFEWCLTHTLGEAEDIFNMANIGGEKLLYHYS